MSSDDQWKLVALEYEYGPNGVDDEYWDANFTKEMIRKDVMWLIIKIKELQKLQKPQPISSCPDCTCGKTSKCDIT